MIDDRLRELAAMLSTHVPASMVEILLSYVEANEAEIGLETLCDLLADAEQPLSSAEVELIQELGRVLALPPERVEQIEELNTGE
ncbi:MafI family immunity protein [Kitasatospora cinereorecta]|uniref:MafI family immunity protein n=1 Tax=Kitasatospora cinereorecta TaxID=285560 RepID=A0ABW0V570_9ACTN